MEYVRIKRNDLLSLRLKLMGFMFLNGDSFMEEAAINVGLLRREKKQLEID